MQFIGRVKNILRYTQNSGNKEKLDNLCTISIKLGKWSDCPNLIAMRDSGVPSMIQLGFNIEFWLLIYGGPKTIDSTSQTTKFTRVGKPSSPVTIKPRKWRKILWFECNVGFYSSFHECNHDSLMKFDHFHLEDSKP